MFKELIFYGQSIILECLQEYKFPRSAKCKYCILKNVVSFDLSNASTVSVI